MQNAVHLSLRKRDDMWIGIPEPTAQLEQTVCSHPEILRRSHHYWETSSLISVGRARES